MTYPGIRKVIKMATANNIDFLRDIRDITAKKMNLTINNCMSVARYQAEIKKPSLKHTFFHPQCSHLLGRMHGSFAPTKLLIYSKFVHQFARHDALSCPASCCQMGPLYNLLTQVASNRIAKACKGVNRKYRFCKASQKSERVKTFPCLICFAGAKVSKKPAIPR